MQVLKDVYLLSGYPYSVSSNVFAVKGKHSIVLIDTGTDAYDMGVIENNLVYWGLSNYPISHVLITHAHLDHGGNAHLFQDRGSKIVASPYEADGLELADERCIGYAFDKKPIPCRVDLRVHEGDIIKAFELDFEVIEAPGHSGGSLIYRLVLDGKIILFTGDTIRVGMNCDSAVLGWSGAVDYNRELYLETLGKISKLEADVILGGHFQPCLQNGWKILGKAYTQALLEFNPPVYRI